VVRASIDGAARPVFNCAASGGALASRVILVAAVEVGLLPPASESARDGSTRRIHDGGLVGNGG
jgi:hypothetical protein